MLNPTRFFAKSMSSERLQQLVDQKKYRQAIEEVKKLHRAQPDAVTSPSIGELWMLRGQQEFAQGDLKTAENSLRQSLKLGQPAYYWLAKVLLHLGRGAVALELIRQAFEQQVLPKEDNVCYLKLLLIQGDRQTVETLIANSGKRFATDQLHWVKGVLALQDGAPQTAQGYFQKVKDPVTPGDSPLVWTVYSLQQQGNWQDAAQKLGLDRLYVPSLLAHPAQAKLVSRQQAEELQENTAIQRRYTTPALEVLTILKLVATKNFHDVGHLLWNLKGHDPAATALKPWRTKLLALAGDQAYQEEEMNCAVNFWQPLLTERDMPAQWWANYIQALYEEDEYVDRQRVLAQLIKWLDREAKRHPDQWPADRLRSTLAEAHCLMVDCFVDMESWRSVDAEMKQAIKLCPTSPEVIGRQGLLADARDQSDIALPLLLEAVSTGCRFGVVYYTARRLLKAADRTAEAEELQRKYGHKWDDAPQTSRGKPQVEMPLWMEALAKGSFPAFAAHIPTEPSTDPALQTCQIFRAAAHGKVAAKGNTSFNQVAAQAEWNELLQTIPATAQAKVLKIIVLCVEVLSKRDKGIVALNRQYCDQLHDLLAEIPTAMVDYLVVLAMLAMRDQKRQKELTTLLPQYLRTQPQPVIALAELQLQVRWCGICHSLRPMLEQALQQEPQNPLLHLAFATTYSVDNNVYDTHHEQGFDLARRLQDGAALQYYRQEEHFVNQKEQPVKKAIPSGFFGELAGEMMSRGLDLPNILEMMMARNTENKASPAQRAAMLEKLAESFMANFDSDDDDDDDYDDDDIDFEMPFRFGASRSSGTKKRKRGFMDL